MSDPVEVQDEVKALQAKNNELSSLVIIGFQIQSASWNEILHLKAAKESTRRELDSINESKNMTYTELVSLKSAVLRLNDKNKELENELARRQIIMNSHHNRINELENAVYYGMALLGGMMFAELVINAVTFFKQ